MTTKTPQQIRVEQVRAKRKRQQELLKRRQEQTVKAREQTAKRPPPAPKPPPPKKGRPTPQVANSATKIDPKPWLAQYEETAFVIGGGPSLMGFNWDVLKNKFVVGINRAYEVLPEAQVIYFTDDDWWNTHKAALQKHKGYKVKGSLNPSKLGQSKLLHQFRLSGATGLDKTPGCLKHGSNSTYAVLNMLTQWGFKKIYLLGVDMKWKVVSKGGNKGNKKTHWHNGHRRIDGESLYNRLTKNFNELAPLLKREGVEVINVNNDSKLTAFPKKTYEEIFGSECFKK